MKEKSIDEIGKVLQERQLDGQADLDLSSDYGKLFKATNNREKALCVEVSVDWGDWKHDHMYTDMVMKELGYTLVDEQVTHEDGSDCYSSNHYYMWAEMWNALHEMFKPKGE